MTLTVYTATPRDVWPDGSGHSREVEDEIMRVAKHEVTAEDVARSGQTFASWYIPYFLAEGIVRQRRETREKLQKLKRQQAPRQPQPQPVAKGSQHPSADKWSKWPRHPDLDKIKDIPDRYREHLKEWHQERQPKLAVYRRELDDRQTPTIGDLRKMYRETIIGLDQLESLIVYLSKRIKALESRPVPKYHGIWDSNQEYEDNSIVTHQGSMWIAKVQTKAVRPGDGNVWTLCVKKGRDGRDLR